MKVFLLAAGLGSRLMPLTSDKPKALVEVCGKPMIERQLRNFHKYGFKDIVINLHTYGEMVEEWVANFLKANQELELNISFSKEYDLLRDTGGGILHAESLLNDGEPFLVHNVDVFTNLDLRVFYDKYKSAIAHNYLYEGKDIAALVVSDRETKRYLVFKNHNLYGRLDTQKMSPDKFRSSFSFADFTTYPFSGIHVLSPSVFGLMKEYILSLSSSEEKLIEKFSIIDFYLRFAKEYNIKEEFVSDLKFVDVGKNESFMEAQKYCYDNNLI